MKTCLCVAQTRSPQLYYRAAWGRLNVVRPVLPSHDHGMGCENWSSRCVSTQSGLCTSSAQSVEPPTREASRTTDMRLWRGSGVGRDVTEGTKVTDKWRTWRIQKWLKHSPQRWKPSPVISERHVNSSGVPDFSCRIKLLLVWNDEGGRYQEHVLMNMWWMKWSGSVWRTRCYGEHTPW